jgi:hypothetical protein
MPDPIIYVDRSRIVEGKLEELKRSILALVEYIERREPRLLSYGFYVDETSLRMTVIAIHPDSASLELHMDIGGPEFRKLSDMVELTGIEVYGSPSENALAQLNGKARMLGRGKNVVVQEMDSGFARLEAAPLR